VKRLNALIATLALGGTIAATSTRHADAFRPVPVAGSIGDPGDATAALPLTGPLSSVQAAYFALFVLWLEGDQEAGRARLAPIELPEAALDLP